MRLRQAHRVLVACMIIFCTGFAALKGRAYWADGHNADLAFAAGFAGGAALLTWYLRRFGREYPPAGGRPGDLL